MSDQSDVSPSTLIAAVEAAISIGLKGAGPAATGSAGSVISIHPPLELWMCPASVQPSAVSSASQYARAAATMPPAASCASSSSPVSSLRDISNIHVPSAPLPWARAVWSHTPASEFSAVVLPSSSRSSGVVDHSSSMLHSGSLPPDIPDAPPDILPGPQSSSQCQMSTLPRLNFWSSSVVPMWGAAGSSIRSITATAGESLWSVGL